MKKILTFLIFVNNNLRVFLYLLILQYSIKMGLFDKLAGQEHSDLYFKDKVRFMNRLTKDDCFYEIYKCDDAEIAKEFLLSKSVNKPHNYLIVETSVGNWGSGIKGLYKEKLQPWQYDLDKAEVIGHATRIIDAFSLESVARRINDNFLVSVNCGDCSHGWVEGLRYQNWTIVKCPNCEKYNKINSEQYQVHFVKE